VFRINISTMMQAKHISEFDTMWNLTRTGNKLENNCCSTLLYTYYNM